MGCEVRRQGLPRGHCRGFRDVRLWNSGHRANLVLARPIGITTATEPWYVVSNLQPSLDLVWTYGQRFSRLPTQRLSFGGTPSSSNARNNRSAWERRRGRLTRISWARMMSGSAHMICDEMKCERCRRTQRL